MLKGGLVLIWELGMNLVPTLLCTQLPFFNTESSFCFIKLFVSIELGQLLRPYVKEDLKYVPLTQSNLF